MPVRGKCRWKTFENLPMDNSDASSHCFCKGGAIQSGTLKFSWWESCTNDCPEQELSIPTTLCRRHNLLEMSPWCATPSFFFQHLQKAVWETGELDVAVSQGLFGFSGNCSSCRKPRILIPGVPAMKAIQVPWKLPLLQFIVCMTIWPRLGNVTLEIGSRSGCLSDVIEMCAMWNQSLVNYRRSSWQNV